MQIRLVDMIIWEQFRKERRNELGLVFASSIVFQSSIFCAVVSMPDPVWRKIEPDLEVVGFFGRGDQRLLTLNLRA